MSRFFIPRDSVKGNVITVCGKEAHHILDVMRLKKLDKVVTFDGTGREYIGFIKDVRAKSLSIEVVETRTPLNKAKSAITLIQAIPKKDKMDYIVEKATELGVSSIVPVLTQRTIPNWDDPKKDAHLERWRKIAREAAKQCGRSDIPQLGKIAPFDEAIKESSEHDLRIMATLSDKSVSLKDALRDFKGGTVAAAIGPEGDFAASEAEEAMEAGFKWVSLGSKVLRSDTAGLALLAILNYELSS